MIKGWTNLDVLGRMSAPVLGALVALGVTLNVSDAREMEADEFAADVRGKALAITTAPFPVVAHLYEDGTIEVQGALGTWQGAWAGADETMCLYFENGPRMGETCVTIRRTADGGFVTSEGSELHPVASAYRY